MGKRDINTDKEGKTLLYTMVQNKNCVEIFLSSSQIRKKIWFRQKINLPKFYILLDIDTF